MTTLELWQYGDAKYMGFHSYSPRLPKEKKNLNLYYTYKRSIFKNMSKDYKIWVQFFLPKNKIKIKKRNKMEFYLNKIKLSVQSL